MLQGKIGGFNNQGTEKFTHERLVHKGFAAMDSSTLAPRDGKEPGMGTMTGRTSEKEKEGTG